MENNIDSDHPPPPKQTGVSKFGFFLLKWLQFAAWWSLVSGVLGFGAYGWAGLGAGYGKGIVIGGFWGLIYALFKLRRYDGSKAVRRQIGVPSWIVIGLMMSVWIVIAAVIVIQPGEEISEPREQKVKTVSINGQVVSDYRPLERQTEVAHVVVVKNNDWVVFDGGWVRDDLEPAIKFGKFETKRRSGTSFQISLAPRYDPEWDAVIYETVRNYDSDGVFQYQK